MIWVNLSTQKKPVDLANVGGFDLSKLNVKLVVIAIVTLYLPDFLLVDSLQQTRATAEATLEELTKKKGKLAKEVAALKDFDVEINSLNRKEEELAKKREIVKDILTTKKNPWSILVYVSKNIPPEAWLTEITYEDSKIKLKSISSDYTSQGVFLENLKKSVFFDKDITFTKTDLATDNPELQGYAPFEMVAKIVRFE